MSSNVKKIEYAEAPAGWSGRCAKFEAKFRCAS